MITQSNIVRILKTSVLVFVLVFSTGGVFPIIAHAQYSGDANCCGGSDIYDLYVSPQTPAQPPQQDIYDLYVSPKAPTTPGTVTVESVPVYTSYDVYAQTPYYASTPY